MTMELPATWRLVRLGDVAQVRLGKMLDKKRTGGRSLPYLRNINVRWGRIDTSDLAAMPFEDRELERYSLVRGDVLVCEGGEPGRAAVCTQDLPNVMYQKALHRVRLAAGIQPNWLVHQLQLDAFTGRLSKQFTGTTIGHLPLEAIVEYPFRIAPHAEQDRVLLALDSYLSRLDDAIANLERVRRNLGRYRSSVLQAAVEGRLVPTEAERAKAEGRAFEPASVLLNRILTERRKRWEASGKKGKYEEPAGPNTAGLPELPEGWCWASVDEILAAPLANGRSVPDGVDGFPVLRLTAVRAGRIDLLACKSGAWTVAEAAPFLVEGGDFLVVRGNGSRHLVGRGGLVADDPSPVAFPDTLIRIRPAKDHLLPDYLCLLWDSGTVRQQVEKKAKTTAGIYKINQAELGSVVLPLPPLAEQQRVVQEVERLVSNAEAVANTVAAQLARCLRLRQSILKWAFEGKLVDQDPNPPSSHRDEALPTVTPRSAATVSPTPL